MKRDGDDRSSGLRRPCNGDKRRDRGEPMKIIYRRVSSRTQHAFSAILASGDWAVANTNRWNHAIWATDW